MSFFNAGLQVPNGEELVLDGSNIVLNGSTSGSITLSVPVDAGSNTYILPANDGTNGQVLQTDGSGNLTFTTVSSGSIAADDITEGDNNVLISTSTGNVSINAPGTANISIADVDKLVISSSNVSSSVDIIPLTNDGSALGSTTNAWKELYIADNGTIKLGDDQDVTITHVPDAGIIFNDASNIQFRDSTSKIYSSATNTLDIASGDKVVITAATANVTGQFETTGSTTIHNTLESTSSVSGALVVSGGVGIGSNLFVGSTANIGGASNVNSTLDVVGATSLKSTLGVTGATTLSSTLDVTGVVNLNDTTTSTSTTTGALIVDGGVGIAENLNVGGDVAITGDLTVSGNVTSIDATHKVIQDPVIELGNTTVTATDSFERGLLVHYGNGASVKQGFIGWDKTGIVGEFIFATDVTHSSNTISSITSYGNAKFADLSLGSTDSADEFTITHSSDVITLKNTVSNTGDIAFNINNGIDTEVMRLDADKASVKINKGFIVGVDSITSNSTVSGTPTELIDSTYYAAVKNINITNDTASFYNVDSNSSNIANGQMLHLFYENGGTANSRLDFGTSNLYAGSGTAQYLTFTQTGQSATLIYLDDGTAGWRIINTGGTIN